MNAVLKEAPWLAELRAACAAASQAEIARRLQRAGDGRYPSPAVINQALKGSYEGDMSRLQGVVEGVLMQATVDCPVIGEIPRQRCIDHQSRRGKFAATNPLRVALHRACPNCDYRR